ncbi:type IV toxin-antitoxin system AbiEi family antitoxin domain-containing protein [Luteipulveratus halotolerans]|uniref:AbiEi antitoxin N-terminal domain-containing protein n=1 Tax=Luteipulveratus halotolerans TaxID=1631356 RepID=A0A0L6CL95_9MICO|nr:type IV toxin-antitoxin system AbiEi family antitoxin domain-containing protein [Luteipulveratus halotolerans]KNX38566.1 hypothetical protein VV01_17725 [Luteipulveratus halotolerans]
MSEATPPPALRHLVGDRPHGLFLASDASTAGVTRRDVARWVQQGVVRRLGRAVYAASPVPSTREEGHRELVRAMLLSHPSVVASHHSALALLGIDLHAVDLTAAHGIWTNQSPTRTVDRFRLMRPARRTPWGHVDGWACVRPSWAITQTAGRFGLVAGVVSADHALRRGMVTEDQLTAAVTAHAGAVGVEAMRRMLRSCDRRSESVGESRLRLICEGAGIEVEPQFRVLDQQRCVARADFRVVGTRLLLEFDGMLKYRAADGQNALEREKRREDACRRLRWDFERFVWAQLDRPSQVVRLIREGIARAPRDA